MCVSLLGALVFHFSLPPYPSPLVRDMVAKLVSDTPITKGAPAASVCRGLCAFATPAALAFFCLLATNPLLTTNSSTLVEGFEPPYSSLLVRNMAAYGLYHLLSLLGSTLEVATYWAYLLCFSWTLTVEALLTLLSVSLPSRLFLLDAWLGYSCDQSKRIRNLPLHRGYNIVGLWSSTQNNRLIGIRYIMLRPGLGLGPNAYRLLGIDPNEPFKWIVYNPSTNTRSPLCASGVYFRGSKPPIGGNPTPIPIPIPKGWNGYISSDVRYMVLGRVDGALSPTSQNSSFSTAPKLSGRPIENPLPYVAKPNYPHNAQSEAKLQLIRKLWGNLYNARMHLVVPILLGDGTISKYVLHSNGPRGARDKKNSRMTFSQGHLNVSIFKFVMSQLRFLDMLPTRERRVYTNGLPPVVMQKDSRTKNTYFRYDCYTGNSVAYNHLRDLWYPDGVKVIPEYIKDYLSPECIANWFMGDGSSTGSGLRLCVDAFHQTDVEWVANQLKQQYGWTLIVRLRDSKKTQYGLYLSAYSVDSFIEQVAPHVHPFMHYKFPRARYYAWLNRQNPDYRQWVLSFPNLPNQHTDGDIV